MKIKAITKKLSLLLKKHKIKTLMKLNKQIQIKRKEEKDVKNKSETNLF